ncbi:pupal cuticle protein PCP52 [Pieris rapae]|uniref:pupal cuticle protein PCP52 n=1 Tax=Pieris rapae TaxID=64459 RepID=UPI000B92A777|nr:pupal cuticle protein PCP52 [Pieris rapae]
MRFLIAAAVLACAAAAPSGLLAYSGLAGPYAHGLAPLAHAPVALAHGPVAVAPTIPPGDIQGAAIDAHVEVSDHVRASADAAREYHDQASEVQGRAINAAEDHAWQAVDAAQTAQAQIDGAAAGVAPNVARQLVGHSALVHATPLVHSAPVVAAPVVAGPLAYGHGYAGARSVATSSLSQTHPAPYVHAPVYSHGIHGLAHAW